MQKRLWKFHTNAFNNKKDTNFRVSDDKKHATVIRIFITEYPSRQQTLVTIKRQHNTPYDLVKIYHKTHLNSI
jgi:hypothetical protein